MLWLLRTIECHRFRSHTISKPNWSLMRHKLPSGYSVIDHNQLWQSCCEWTGSHSMTTVLQETHSILSSSKFD